MTLSADILNVGHGACTLIYDNEWMVVVDVKSFARLEDQLNSLGRDVVDELVITHLDKDHSEGVNALLDSSIAVRRIYVNPDLFAGAEDFEPPPRQQELDRDNGENDLELSAWEADKSRRVRLLHKLLGRREIVRFLMAGGRAGEDGPILGECVWPHPALFLGFPNEIERLVGFRLTRNRTSIVTRWISDDREAVWVCGDSDFQAVEAIMALPPERRLARLVIFPHHGSAAGGMDAMGSESLIAHTEPTWVAFQNGRGQYALPKREVIDGVKSAGSRVRVLCTGLHESCYTGDDMGRHCAGTIRFTGVKGGSVATDREAHTTFVSALPRNGLDGGAMCVS